MSQKNLLAVVCVMVAGCTSGTQDQSDFGAAVVAGYVVEAQHACAHAGYQDLIECKGAPRSSDKARMAALTADDAYSMFQVNCYGSVGAAKCEEFISSAYAQATKAAAHAQSKVRVPAPAQSTAP